MPIRASKQPAGGVRRVTKVVWSFAEKSLNDDLAQVVATADPDAVRIGYTEGSDDRLIAFLKSVRNQSRGDLVPTMVDLTPPARARLNEDIKPHELTYGQEVRLSVDPKGDDLGVDTADWKALIKPGVTVYFGFGNIVAEVIDADEVSATCKVLQGGEAFPKMTIHVPETRKRPKLPYLDKMKIEEMEKLGVDYLVIPGFLDPKDIKALRERFSSLGDAAPWLVLRIDRKEVYEDLRDLLPLVNGVVISRRELALTMEPARIPIVTKEIVQVCNDSAKLVLIASEILGSMRHNPTPTRAEVSDIANSVMDGADGVVISDDIPFGPHALKSLKICQEVLVDIEKNGKLARNWLKESPTIRNELDAVSSQAYRVAERLNAKAIVCLTKGGNTALKLSSFRQSKPIIALTFSHSIMRKLSLVSGVEGVVLGIEPSLEEVLPVVNDLLKRGSSLVHGDKYVFVTVTISPVGRESSNLFTVQEIS